MAKNCPKRKIILGLWPMIYDQLVVGVMFFHQLLAATLGVHFGWANVVTWRVKIMQKATGPALGKSFHVCQEYFPSGSLT